MTEPRHALTTAQQSVVDQPWDARTLVTAGAGAGKTHTLVRRLEALVARQELEAHEILVLTFSRAAVRELRERIENRADAARRVRAQTFDSWATSLLRRAYPDRDWSGTTFDQRIKAATEGIEMGAVEAGEFGAPAHVLIDEVQDLVGVRREMVEVLLDRFQDQSGFTVVGDGAQAVYDFQVTDSDQRARETNYFFDWIRGSFAEDLVEIHLGDNFRARTERARVALPYGPRLRQLAAEREPAEAQAELIHRELRLLLDEAPHFGTLDDVFVLDSLRYFDGTTAILCRDNGQALTLSQTLHEAGVDHRLQRSVRDRPAPAWIAGLLASTDAADVSERRFTELIAGLDPRPDLDASVLARAVRRVAGNRRGGIELAALRLAVAEGRLPDELMPVEQTSLVVSSVHRAKGLEFDRVLVVEPVELRRPKTVAKKRIDYDPAAEARLLYVAMTRPRDDLYRLDRPNTWLVRKDRRLDRWYLGGSRSWARNGIEALGLDVCRAHPPGLRNFAADPVEIQRHLAHEVRPGDAVELSLLHRLPDVDQTPPYAIVHDGRRVGEVSEPFRHVLHLMLGRGGGRTDYNVPGRITGLRLDCVETVAGSHVATESAGLGGSGAWLVPRLSGLGRFDWCDSFDVSNTERLSS
ncbi:UvrD-helicase domain-containing protein [Yinghuangia sp. ASG 101]|uniref:UvrD-helicase domain-containing protein n=1 Tax=Yinghuangia sp. ASG 101 TaxID=2896848 RepID=UPI001E512096|nr:UvrD-helicase domain-containing protein [Yinghuangia sp. ASG 101]UGQ13485.1 UvrD-helicase domain-containing protein [Yinghuangia sp. ASG 101]